ncbi:hypothetical protein PFISCL1PPCAC_20828, partial [Pristionchus fissidentatus]
KDPVHAEFDAESVPTSEAPLKKKKKINVSTLHERITLPGLPDYFDVMKLKMRSDNVVLAISQLVPGNMKRGINEKEVEMFVTLLHQGRFD